MTCDSVCRTQASLKFHLVFQIKRPRLQHVSGCIICLHRLTAGPGEQTTKREEAEWQQKSLKYVAPAHEHPYAGGRGACALPPSTRAIAQDLLLWLNPRVSHASPLPQPTPSKPHRLLRHSLGLACPHLGPITIAAPVHSLISRA